jgi:hypothetical protein
VRRPTSQVSWGTAKVLRNHLSNNSNVFIGFLSLKVILGAFCG